MPKQFLALTRLAGMLDSTVSCMLSLSSHITLQSRSSFETYKRTQHQSIPDAGPEHGQVVSCVMFLATMLSYSWEPDIA